MDEDERDAADATVDAKRAAEIATLRGIAERLEPLADRHSATAAL